jgi:hypothetical protein
MEPGRKYIEVPEGYEAWTCEVDDWYQQQRHDLPECYGTTKYYRRDNVTVIWEEVTQVQDWLDPMNGVLESEAGTRTNVWAYEEEV